MTERCQHRWFLTRRAVDLLYVTDHHHPGAQGGGKGRRPGLSSIPEGELPADFTGTASPWTTTIRCTWRTRASSPFATAGPVEGEPGRGERPRPRAPAVDRHVAGASRPPCVGWPCWSRSTALAPGPAAQRAGGQPARCRRRGIASREAQDDRLPAAPARRLLPRRGPLRTRTSGPPSPTPASMPPKG